MVTQCAGTSTCPQISGYQRMENKSYKNPDTCHLSEISKGLSDLGERQVVTFGSFYYLSRSTIFSMFLWFSVQRIAHFSIIHVIHLESNKMAASFEWIKSKVSSSQGAAATVLLSGPYKAIDSMVLKVTVEDKDCVQKLSQVCVGESQRRLLGLRSKSMMSSVDSYYPLEK